MTPEEKEAEDKTQEVWNNLRYKHEATWIAIEDHMIYKNNHVGLTLKISLFKEIYPYLSQE